MHHRAAHAVTVAFVLPALLAVCRRRMPAVNQHPRAVEAHARHENHDVPRPAAVRL